MALVTQNIVLDINSTSEQQVVRMTQGTTAASAKIYFTAMGKIIDLSGCTFEIVDMADGSSTPVSSAGSEDDGVVWNIPEAVTAVSGYHYFQLIVTDANNRKVYSPQVRLYIMPSISG